MVKSSSGAKSLSRTKSRLSSKKSNSPSTTRRLKLPKRDEWGLHRKQETIERRQKRAVKSKAQELSRSRSQNSKVFKVKGMPDNGVSHKYVQKINGKVYVTGQERVYGGRRATVNEALTGESANFRRRNVSSKLTSLMSKSQKAVTDPDKTLYLHPTRSMINKFAYRGVKHSLKRNTKGYKLAPTKKKKPYNLNRKRSRVIRVDNDGQTRLF